MRGEAAARRTVYGAVRLLYGWVNRTLVEFHMGNHAVKVAMVGSFGIALLGLYFIFNSTNNPNLSFSGCAMYIVGAVVGIILSQQ